MLVRGLPLLVVDITGSLLFHVTFSLLALADQKDLRWDARRSQN